MEFCDRIASNRLDRAVIFLDPSGLSVRWQMIERIAATKKVEGYLVPVDGMSRQIKEDGSFLPGAAKIDEIWGSTAWRTKAVRRSDTSEDLFGGVDERLEKIAKASSSRKCSAIISKTCLLAELRKPISRWVEDDATISL